MNTTNLPFSKETLHTLLSSNVVSLLKWILLTGVCQIIAVFGTLANIVNIICLIKQGFAESFNVSLLGLAVSDLGCLITVIWSNICNTPAFTEADLLFDVMDIFYLTSIIPHLMFSRITAWITALITLERCLCIASPLKVKRIITPKRVSFITVSVFLILMAIGAPVYLVSKLTMTFFPSRNKTILGLVHTKDRDTVEKASYLANSIVPTGAFVVISVSTIILVIKLKRTARWRKTSVTPGQSETMSSRNQRVAKMVVMISTLFICCFIPMCIIYVAMALLPELAIDGKDFGTVLLVGGIGTILESINSSMNIFIYYRMSSNYRAVLRQLFCLPHSAI